MPGVKHQRGPEPIQPERQLRCVHHSSDAGAKAFISPIFSGVTP
jgi:hypothetical protein